VAEAAEGFRFVNWTGDVGTLADVNAAASTITMSADYSIVANFQIMPMVAAGCYQTVGLKTDGTMVAEGKNEEWQCHASAWMDILLQTTNLEFVDLKN
jgi:hypothetical protein